MVQYEQINFFGDTDIIIDYEDKKEKTTYKKSSINHNNIIPYTDDIHKCEIFSNNYKYNSSNVIKYTYDKYLGNSQDIVNKIKELCITDGNFLIESLTGSGKGWLFNYAFSELSKKHLDRMFIIACPSRILNLQNEANKNYNFKALVGGKTIEEIHKTTNIITMLYDKAGEVLEYCKKYKLDITLVIDECHNIVQASKFRKKALDELNELQNVAKTVIHLSSTTRENKLLFKYDKVIKCIPRVKPIEKEKIIIGIGSHDNLKKYLIKTVELEIKGKNKILIFLNNKEKTNEIIELMKGLKKHFKDKSIDYLDSSKKESDLFKYIVDNSVIPNDIDILLVSSLMEAGLNIHNENLTVLFYVNNLNHFSLTSIEQSLSRARAKQKKAYILTNKPEKEKNFLELRSFSKSFMKKIYEKQDRVKNMLNFFLKENYPKEEIYASTNSLINEGLDIYDKKITDFLNFDMETGEFNIDEPLAIIKLLREFDLQYFSNEALFKEYIKDRCKTNEVIIDYIDNESISINESDFKKVDDKIKENKKLTKEENKILVQNSKEKIKNSLNNRLLDYLENINEAKSIRDEFYNRLNSDEKELIDNTHIAVFDDIKDIINETKKEKNGLKKLDTKKIKQKDFYTIDFKERVNIYLNSSNKAQYKNNINIKRFECFNNQVWSKDKENLEYLYNTFKLDYAGFRLFFDSKRGRRITDNLLEEYNKFLKKDKDMTKSKKTEIIKKINTVYIISKDNKISSIK